MLMAQRIGEHLQLCNLSNDVIPVTLITFKGDCDFVAGNLSRANVLRNGLRVIYETNHNSQRPLAI